jgi:hypothetical protein
MSNQTTVRYVHVPMLWGQKPRWCFVGIIFMEQCLKNYARMFFLQYYTILRTVGL